MNRELWYSAQCIFLHDDNFHGPKQMYEERIVLLRAESTDAAIERAEEEAERYCSDVSGCRYIGYVNVFAMYDDEISDGSEIFSSMQSSELGPKEYLDLHYPDTPENCEAVGESHRWHNLDDKQCLLSLQNNSRGAAVGVREWRLVLYQPLSNERLQRLSVS